MVRKISLVMILLLAGLALSGEVRAAAAGEPARSRWLREAGINLGYGTGSTKEGSYEFVSVLPRVGIDLGEVFGLLGLKPPGTLEVVLEPLANVVIEPDLDLEAGAGLLFKYGWRIGRFMPYIEGGAGVVSMNELVREQAGGCNFIPQIGPGLHYFLTPNWALTASYRFRHLSDCGLDERNHGINSSLFLVGASFIYAPDGPPGFTSRSNGEHY
jgi:lipid A 3-O-deacylase